MTTGEYSPLLRDGGGRTSSAQAHQAIDAHYYNITDSQSWPIAGLLVLLDNRRQPVRAELQIDNEFDDYVVEAALRQARVVLQDHYIGGEPVPVTILTTSALRDAIDVRLPPVGSRVPRFSRGRQGLWAGGALAAVAILVTVLGIALLRPGAQEGVGPVVGTPTATVELTPLAAAGMGAAPAVAPGARTADTDALPTSRNARPDIRVGIRVQVVPTLQVALRTEPGIQSGTTIRAMSDQDRATVIGGPEYTRGESDTIVWWYLQLDTGEQAWAAANTSDRTLLIPAN